jgi:predicted nuclease of predicted toxin-antitoxin system
VKFLVDNQLPPALSEYLRNRGFDCQHVLEVGLADALDRDICRYAELQERIIISKDEDFFYFTKQREAKIRVVWVRLGNCRTRALLAAFERSWPDIESCLNAGDRIIEIR